LVKYENAILVDSSGGQVTADPQSPPSPPDTRAARRVRLPPLPDDAWDDEVRAALTGFLPRRRHNAREAGNALATLVRHPDLARSFLGFNVHLLVRSTLPARLRELAILRVAARRGCGYEWTHHARMAAAAGLTPAEIERAGRHAGSGDRASVPDGLEAAVLRAVDELDDDSVLSDRTWGVLCEHLDERQLMDLVFTVGAYCLLAMAFNSFGVEPDPDPGPER
jgi:AhpD family alkylhydroperoxidase